MRIVLPSLLAAILSISCAAPSHCPEAGSDGGAESSARQAHLAHDKYVAAINSNDVEQMLAMLTDDVVFMGPNEPVKIGKDAIRPWLEGYVAYCETHWEKPVQEFVVNGEWAYERYSYTSTDKPHAGGDPVVGTGWGLIIYHLDDDGVWRVARDAWGSDQPAQ